jgi:hypothetical protein
MRQLADPEECQACAMEQYSILLLGTFRAAGEYQHRGVQAAGIGTSPALGKNLDGEDFAGW